MRTKDIIANIRTFSLSLAADALLLLGRSSLCRSRGLASTSSTKKHAGKAMTNR